MLMRILVVAAVVSAALIGFGGVALHELETRTEAREWKSADGKTFRYRWHEPKSPETEKGYPLIVFMHGVGERGTNNVSQLKWCVRDIFDYMEKRGEEFFFVAGQVPDPQQWVDYRRGSLAHTMSERPSETMGLQISFLEELFAKKPGIDRSRVYVCGLSMGGFGTWDILCRRPEWFAAAMPVCGGVDLSQLWKLREIPIWIHHGDKDTTVPFVRSRQATATLWACNGNVKYTEYPNCGHGSWGPAFKDERHLDWLLSQKKSAK